MFSFFQNQDAATADTESDDEYDSDETVAMGDTGQILAEANGLMKPGLNNKSVVAYQRYDDADVSRHMIMKGGSRYLFLKHANTGASVIVCYTGRQAVEGSSPGDLFKPNTIKRCHLTGLETKALEKAFQMQPDGIVSLDDHTKRTAWRERLITYFLLLESNMFSPSIDVVGKAERQKFLYDFLVVRSPLDRLSIARKFKNSIVRVYGDEGVLNEVETIDVGPKRKRRKKLSLKNLLEANKALQLELVTLKPKSVPKPALLEDLLEANKALQLELVTLKPKSVPKPAFLEDLLEASKELQFEIVALKPKSTPERQPKPPPQSAPPVPFDAAQGVQASKELGFDLVTIEKPRVSALVQQEATKKESSLTANLGLEASRQLGFDLVTLKKKL